MDETSSERQAANAAIECINCAVCYAACDVVASNPDYLGPAALNRAWSLVNDVRDGGREAILEAVSGTGGCHNCHSQQSCQEILPERAESDRFYRRAKTRNRKTCAAKFFFLAHNMTTRKIRYDHGKIVYSATADSADYGPIGYHYIAVMIYAVQNGLSAVEILARTQRQYLLGYLYGLFAIAVAIHAAIGLRAILPEWVRLEGTVLNVVCWFIALGAWRAWRRLSNSVTG